MSRSIFSKFSIIPFLTIAGASILISSIGSVVGKNYYSTQRNTTNVFKGDSTKLAQSFTLKEFLGDDAKITKWIDENANFEIYTKYNNEFIPDEQILRYNKSSKKFDVVGVGEGYITFTLTSDPSVNFTKSFVTSFNSENTVDLIKSFNTALGNKGVYTKDELDSISYVKVDNSINYDFADIIYFPKMDSVIVDHLSSNLFEPINFNLNSKTYIYVGSFYDKYMESSKEIWEKYRSRIYVEKPDDDEVNIIIYKNQGVFKTDDNQKSYQSFLVKKDIGFEKLSSTAIERHGYNFVNYTEYLDSKNVFDEKNVFSKNTKIVANFTVKTYNVNFHMLSNDGETSITKTFIYDEETMLFEKSKIPEIKDRTFVGWSKSKTDLNLDYKCEDMIVNLNEGLDCDLYAFYSWNNYSIKFTDDNGKNLLINEVNGDYTQDETIVNQFVDLTKGILIGWSTKAESETAEYSCEDVIAFKKIFSINFEDPKPVLLLHAVYSNDDLCTIHFIANGKQLNYSIPDVSRGTPFSILSPKMICNDANYVEKTGYKLVGWKDVSSPEGQVFYYDDITDKDTKIEIEAIYFATTTYTYEAVYEINTLKFELPYYESTTSVDRQYKSKEIKFGEELQVTNTFFYRIGYEFKQLDFEFMINGEMKNVVLVPNYETNIVFVASETLKLYQFIIDSGITNQEFDASNIIIKGVDKYKNDSPLSYEIKFDANGGTFNDGTTSRSVNVSYNDKPSFSNVKGNYAPTMDGCTFSYWECTNGSATIEYLETYKFTYKQDFSFRAIYTKNPDPPSETGTCVLGDTKVELISGETVEIKDVKLGDYVKTYNFMEGKVNYAPIVYLESLPETEFNIISLRFDDGTVIQIEGAHVFFDTDLMKYVTISILNFEQFIGRSFAKVNSFNEIEEHKLINAFVEVKKVSVYEILTGDSQISFICNDYLSSSNFTEPLVSMFKVNEDYKYDIDSMIADIEKYGLFEYEDLEFIGLSKELFDALNAKYLKIAISKGLITLEDLNNLYKEHFYEDPSIFYI